MPVGNFPAGIGVKNCYVSFAIKSKDHLTIKSSHFYEWVTLKKKLVFL